MTNTKLLLIRSGCTREEASQDHDPGGSAAHFRRGFVQFPTVRTSELNHLTILRLTFAHFPFCDTARWSMELRHRVSPLASNMRMAAVTWRASTNKSV